MGNDTPAFALDPEAATRVRAAGQGNVVVLTGAGISAESGIPTFRGKEGYWTVGAREYHPQELATHAAFRAMPWEVWAWYLYRRDVCRAAAPNAAHVALVDWAGRLGDRLTLVTQNVDGLHARAGSRRDRTFEIHGNIDRMRCARECTAETFEVPAAAGGVGRGDSVDAARRALLVCPRCGGPSRPHVLWFDESYDEPRYALDRTRLAATRADLLIVVGTSAQTNLPWQVVRLAASNRALIVDINVEDNPFGDLAAITLRAPATLALPLLL